MSGRSLRIVILGLSLSSSWGNGHATTYRSLIKAMAARGHRTLFLERDVSWYASHRDVKRPAYCRLRLYRDLQELRKYQAEIAASDAVIVGSFVPDGTAVIDAVLGWARGVTAFYDIDTPVTLAAVEEGTCAYLRASDIPRFDLYLSFTGGPLLNRIGARYGARKAAALYCSADTAIYRPLERPKKWDLGYLGTYSADRQPLIERFLFEPARRNPRLRCVVAGAQYPRTENWPENVGHIAHLEPGQHTKFYSSLRWALNVTRENMVQAGYSPSVRLFEASACAVPVISDKWLGIGRFFAPGSEILLADSADDVLGALALPEACRSRFAQAARTRFLREHTSADRAAELELLLFSALAARWAVPSERQYPTGTEAELEGGTYVTR
jgi:spore maturation protein CgeB